MQDMNPYDGYTPSKVKPRHFDEAIRDAPVSGTWIEESGVCEYAKFRFSRMTFGEIVTNALVVISIFLTGFVLLMQ